MFSVKDGWAKLCEFLELSSNPSQQFPHENQGESATEFMRQMWEKTATDYDDKVEKEIAAWMAQNGYECKKIKKLTGLRKTLIVKYTYIHIF